MEQKNRKAIALLSGGLDSMLAARVVQEQGIEVIGLHLLSPFGCRDDVQKTADALGVRLIVKDKGEAYLELVKNPRYGYGKAMNPCIDCRIYMFQIAEQIMEAEGADFILTGEVLGQRPMSQQRNAMNLIDRKSGIEDKVLRPLSAHLFSPSLPEREGWIDRESLFAISGRQRKEQMALVEQYDLKAYSAPGGGCLLTETGFVDKLQDFYRHEHYATSEERLTHSELLRYGRHFRISDSTKIIVSRDEKENEEIKARWTRANAHYFYPVNFKGPVALVLGNCGEEERTTVGEMIARYGKSKDLDDKLVGFESKQSSGTYSVKGSVSEERLNALRL